MHKLKKLLTTALALTLCATATLNLAACEQFNNLFNQQSESQDPQHVHTFGEWTIFDGATNCNGATFQRICDGCTKVEQRTGPEDDHGWSGYKNNITHHWTVCTLCNTTSAQEVHSDNGAANCRSCNYAIPSECVYYEISTDGTYAIVTGYDEAETDVINVAEEYEGLPVKEIKASAFEGCTSLQRVTLPDTITTIGANAFNGCGRLLGIYLDYTVTTIGQKAFHGCTDLTIMTAYGKDQIPSGWANDWYGSIYTVIWNHAGVRAANVSAGAALIVDSPLAINDADQAQILVGSNPNGVKAPDGFYTVTHYNSKTTPPGTPWTEGNLWYYNWNRFRLTDYSEVWFAIKVENGFWAFVHETDKNYNTPWMHIYLKQIGETDDGFTKWYVEASIGGYVYSSIAEQSGRYVDDNRPTNSLPRLLWDEGYGSPDGSAILIYLYEKNKPVNLYCTEVCGIKKAGV